MGLGGQAVDRRVDRADAEDEHRNEQRQHQQADQHAAAAQADGQGGVPEAPFEIDTVVDYQKVADVLSGRGYKDDDIENVMYRNWQRCFEKWLPSESDQP